MNKKMLIVSLAIITLAALIIAYIIYMLLPKTTIHETTPISNSQLKNIVLPNILDFCQTLGMNSSSYCPSCYLYYDVNGSRGIQDQAVSYNFSTSSNSYNVIAAVRIIYGYNTRNGPDQLLNFTIDSTGNIISSEIPSPKCI